MGEKRGARLRLCAWLGAVALALLPGVPAAADTVRIITSPEHDARALDTGFVRAAFMMRQRQWPDGTPVRVFVLPDHDGLHAQFTRQELGTYPYVLRGLWDRLVYTGTGFAPTVVQTEKEMLEKVQATRGAIGYARTGPGGAMRGPDTESAELGRSTR